MDLEDVVVRRGWTATLAELRETHSRIEIAEALQDGRIERISHGNYSLPGLLGAGRAAATRVNGVISHLSAATYWGLAVRMPPPEPTITVPRGRKLSSARRADVAVAWADLPRSDVRAGVTTPVRTVIDCAARLPFPEALVVADSALRKEMVTGAELVARAEMAPKHVRDRVLKVALEADSRAASAMESLVRAYSRDVPNLHLVPQLPVLGLHPDLGDEVLGLLVECDSFEFHSERADLLRDCERYNRFALAENTLVRFGWEHAMNRPGYVREVLRSATEVRQNLIARLALAAG